MKIIQNIQVPTGNILICQGQQGLVETLSIADYGKETNLKADFLGLSKAPKPFQHSTLLPLTKKWVVTISTQYGCSMNCTFCDVPKVGPGKNISFNDLRSQILTALTLHPQIKTSKRLNIHFARMGEPSFNPDVLDTAKWLHTHLNPEYNVHPVVSTMMPKNNKWLKTFIHNWMRIKNRLYAGNAGLQLSINSTNEQERAQMFSNNTLPLYRIAQMLEGIIPVGRKITLNFAVADYEINPTVLLQYFDPEFYLIKLTPIHKTTTAKEHNIQTNTETYTSYTPYEELEKKLKAAGYDVLVFLASDYEDLSRITCGNAILSGTLPETPYTILD